MRILVIEDSEKHVESAKMTLSSHELTIIGSFDEFRKAFGGENIIETPPFDVVLTDMNMPMGKRNPYGSNYDREKAESYGLIIALKAAMAGIKFVALLTDANHHNDGMSSALGDLHGAYYGDFIKTSPHRVGNKNFFNINGARVAFLHAPFYKDRKAADLPEYPCPDEMTSSEKNEWELRKDWGRVLSDLIA